MELCRHAHTPAGLAGALLAAILLTGIAFLRPIKVATEAAQPVSIAAPAPAPEAEAAPARRGEVTQAELIAHEGLAKAVPLLREAALQIADPPVRYLGTVGGQCGQWRYGQ